MRRTWAGLERYVDAERFAQVSAFLAIQEQEAQWWRDACIAYFQTFSKRPLPAGFAPPRIRSSITSHSNFHTHPAAERPGEGVRDARHSCWFADSCAWPPALPWPPTCRRRSSSPPSRITS